MDTVRHGDVSAVQIDDDDIQNVGDFVLKTGVNADDKRCGSIQDLEQVGRQKGNVCVSVLERVHERRQRVTGILKTSVAFGVEEDFVLRHDGRKEGDDGVNAQILKQPLDAGSGHGDALTVVPHFDRVLVSYAQSERHRRRRTAGPDFDQCQQVSYQLFQFEVHLVDEDGKDDT